MSARAAITAPANPADEPLRILRGDCRATLPTLADESIDCCVTSPPYWGLRDYGYPEQIGLEPTPESFVDELVAVFREVRRALKPEGTLWVNMGDGYCSSSAGLDNKGANKGNPHKPAPGLKHKDLIGQPWLLAFALRADGWYLRADIIWHKPNPMPESVRDRPTKAHEYVFLFSKSRRYFYNAEAIKEPATGNANPRGSGVNPKAARVPSGWDTRPGGHTELTGRYPRAKQNASFPSAVNQVVESRNARSVWTIPTQPYPDAHFATFPEALARNCILAGCPPGGAVLDPFAGSGTVGQVALSLGNRAVLLEQNPDYVELIQKRCAQRTIAL